MALQREVRKELVRSRALCFIVDNVGVGDMIF